MRATEILVTALIAAAAVVGGRALPGSGFDVARAEGVAAPPASVPGPHRPIVEPPPLPAVETPADKRRPQAKPPQEPARPTVRVEPPQPPAPPPALLEGAFRPGAAGEKAAGRALARPAANELKLEKLAVTPGRDLELWLVAVDRLVDGADLTDTKHVSLGRLKKTEGDQTYRLPPELDLKVYRTVVVWSRRERSARAGALLVPQAVQRPVKVKSSRKG